MREVGAATTQEPTEDEPANEGGDEAAAAQRHGDAVRQRGGGERDDLQPVLGHETTWLHDVQQHRSKAAGDNAADHAVADLLGDDLHGVATAERLLVDVSNREGNQE